MIKNLERLDNLENLNLIKTDNYNDIFEVFVNKIKNRININIGFIYFSVLVDIKRDINIHNNFKIYDIILPDGIGMQIYFSSVFGNKIPNLNGTDLIPEYIKFLEIRNIPYSFYGTTKKNVKDCALKNKAYYYQDGFSELKWSKIKNDSCLFIGLGINKQEEFILKNKNILREKNIQVISVGGFIDFCSGNVKRAPKWVRHIKLEFLYRLVKNPRAHFRKNMLNFSLIYLIIKDRISLCFQK